MGHYIHFPVVDMRESPSLSSKMGSQGLFGERVEILERAGERVRIQTEDSYTGWVDAHSLLSRSIPYPVHSFVEVSRLAAHIFPVKDTEYGPLKTVPFGTKLAKVEDTDPRWIEIVLPDETIAYIQRGDVAALQPTHKKGDLVSLSQRFLGLPYTWGGRSSFGFDCSGFVQMLYSRLGVSLPRNACDQMRDSRFQTIPVDKAAPGDLIFFRKSEKQMHVGLICGEGRFIHATARENQPFIRVSQLSDFEWSGSEKAHYPERVARTLTR